MPVFCYEFTLGLVLAAADTHSTVQTALRLAVEVMFFVLLAKVRTHRLRTSNVWAIAARMVNVVLATLNFAILPQRCLTTGANLVFDIVFVVLYAPVTAALCVVRLTEELNGLF